MIKQFKEAVALQPDGIAIYGFPGDAAMRPIIQEAREMGIVITTMNTLFLILKQNIKLKDLVMQVQIYLMLDLI